MPLFRGRVPEEPAERPLPAQVLARILDLVQRVGAVENPQEALSVAVDAAIDLTEAERGWILIQRPGGVLEVAASRRRGGGNLEDPLAKISRTLVERALGEDKGLCVDEAREDLQLGAAASVNEMRLRAVLCVPFRLEDARGVFYLDNRFASGVFDAEALRMLSAFSGPVAMILRHSELEHRLAETNDALAHANRDLDKRLRDRTTEVRRLEGLATPAAGGRDDQFPEILGRSPAIVRVVEALERAAVGAFPVLLRGESGTGKDLAARALHRVSGRQDEPFVAVACAALQADLLEAELFGVRRGAYTGADSDREGLLASAGAGTLYLDALDGLPLDLQPKLLRVLEDGSYRPVGGGPVQRCAARVVAACRQDLAEAVREGRFREDLYYRVRVFEIALPPLRARRGDLSQLLAHFLAAAGARAGVQAPPVDAESQARLQAHKWPGNVREVDNFATRWVAFGGDLPPSEWARLLAAEEAAKDDNLRSLSDRHLLQVLGDCGGNKAAAARRLGISRRTLYNRLQSLEAAGGAEEPVPEL